MLQANRLSKRLEYAITFMVGLALILSTAAPLFAISDPMTESKTVFDGAIKILADKQTPLADRQRKLKDLLEGKFDFDHMSRSALGRHWRDISADQQKQF